MALGNFLGHDFVLNWQGTQQEEISAVNEGLERAQSTPA